MNGTTGEVGRGRSANAHTDPEVSASWDGLWTLDDEWHPATTVDAWYTATEARRLATLDVVRPIL